MDLKFQDGLIPAIIQDRHSGKVLMLGYMNEAAYHQTLSSGNVTFFAGTRWLYGLRYVP